MSWLTVSDLTRGGQVGGGVSRLLRVCLPLSSRNTDNNFTTCWWKWKKKQQSEVDPKALASKWWAPQANSGHTHTRARPRILLLRWPNSLPVIVMNFPYSETLWPVLCRYCHFLADLQFKFQMVMGSEVSHRWRGVCTQSPYSLRSLCQHADLGVVMHDVLICCWRNIEMSWKIVLSRTSTTAFELDRIKLAGLLVLLHCNLKQLQL